jgi:iron complex transport system substrate-binding protein
MKKLLAMILALAMLLALATGCGSGTATDAAESADTQESEAVQESETAQESEAVPESEPAEDTDHYPVTISTYNYEKEPVEVTFTQAPTRVICTNQSQTELLLYFGLDDAIIGTAYLDGSIRSDLQAQYDALVEAGKELTVVGYPDKETVLALEPDFIFGWRSAFADTALGDVSEWNDLGVGTMVLRCSNNTADDLTVNSVLADIADIGAIFDIEDKTDAYIDEANALLTDIQTQVSALDQEQVQKVLLLEYEDEGMWYAWPVNCLSGSLVEAAGGVNLVTEGADVSLEDIINYAPDAIIVDYFEGQYGDDYDQEEAIAAAIATITGEASLAEVPAVANGKVMGINLTDIYGGGIRIVPSIQTIYEFLYDAQ